MWRKLSHLCFLSARARLCVCVHRGLYLICCLRNTITFLLSDRVSRHTRDRARQCALETGDGARAPKPSASFTDREPFSPDQISCLLAFLHAQPRKLRERYDFGLFYLEGLLKAGSLRGRKKEKEKRRVLLWLKRDSTPVGDLDFFLLGSLFYQKTSSTTY